MKPEAVRRSGPKFRAFRAWTLDGYRLRSANPAGGYWTAGINHAECRRSEYDRLTPLGHDKPPATVRPSHDAPHPRCRCGLYAWHEPHELTRFGGAGELVHGVVLMWGRIEVHGEGLRSEYAEPVLLAYGDEQTHKHVRRVQAIASELGLPAVELDDLEEAAKAFGEPVPEELRPHRTRPLEGDPRWVAPLAAGGLLLATAGMIGGLMQAQRRAATARAQSSPTPPSREP